MHMGGVRAYAIVFLLNHEALMTRLLAEAWGEEREFTFKMAMLGEEIMDLECKVRDLVAKLHEHEVFTLRRIKVGSSIRKVVVLGEKYWSRYNNKLTCMSNHYWWCNDFTS